MLYITSYQKVFRKTSLEDLEAIIDSKIEFELDSNTVDQVNRYLLNLNLDGRMTADTIKTRIQLRPQDQGVLFKVSISIVKHTIAGLLGGIFVGFIIYLRFGLSLAISLGIISSIAVAFTFIFPAFGRSKELAQELFENLK